MELQAHHGRAVVRLINEYQDDPRFNALIIGGSVAKGCARPDSDVDFLIVATDEEFDRRRTESDLFINRKDLCDYDGGYVDGKIINHSYLDELADKGNEPSRAAFEGAFIAYSRLPRLDALLKKIPVYPEHDRDRRIKAFYSMAFIQHWLIHESLRHGNRYTIMRAAGKSKCEACR
jgi:predicted nucleotidyltransferase